MSFGTNHREVWHNLTCSRLAPRDQFSDELARAILLSHTLTLDLIAEFIE